MGRKATPKPDLEPPRVTNRCQVTVSMPIQLYQEAERFLDNVPMSRSEAFSAAMVMFLGASAKDQERAVGALATLAMRDRLAAAAKSLDNQRHMMANLLDTDDG